MTHSNNVFELMSIEPVAKTVGTRELGAHADMAECELWTVIGN
jgi:hypothetical protein